MFRRLTELITPPVRKAPQPQTPFVPAPQPDLNTMLKPMLRRLTTAASLDEPAAKEALNDLKRTALERGLYLAAFELRTLLDMLPKQDPDGTVYEKQRGYVLAGDFFLAHIQRELENARTTAQMIGPNIFKGYCDEMIECLLRSANVRRAIEIPVTIVDSLLIGALDRPSRTSNYLELASQTATSATTLNRHRFERQAHPQSRSGNSSLDQRSPFTALDEPALSYIQLLKQRVGAIQAELSPHLAGWAAKESDGMGAKLERAQALLPIARAVGYAGFRATVEEWTAGLLAEAQPANAPAFYHSAAIGFEEQGDVEIDLFFTKLAGRRYTRALSLFQKCGDVNSAARAQSKVEQAALRGKV